MKARKLREIFNNTKYVISNRDDYIAVGTGISHALINVDKKTLQIRYRLSTSNNHRSDIILTGNKELLFIWDKLNELIQSGEIKDIIEGRDTIENPIPVFTVTDGELIESVTDKIGYPNTDDNGVLMYDNTHFNNKKDAVLYGIREYGAGARTVLETIRERKRELSQFKERRKMYLARIKHLKSLIIEEIL